jgi:hypothetical protein
MGVCVLPLGDIVKFRGATSNHAASRIRCFRMLGAKHIFVPVWAA